jgi:hypothetical protein
LQTAHVEILKHLDELQIPHIDVTNDLMNGDYVRFRNTPDDIVHPNFEGHAIVANRLIWSFPTLFQ